jgi:hypothetical protein
MDQDTGIFRTNTKDQFYTDRPVAKQCINSILSKIPYASECLWLEPSAGNGAFLHQVPPHIESFGLDLDPRAPDITQCDFLTWAPPVFQKKVIVFGNPPFGRQSSLAKSFIRKSCAFADVIAFILPRSFVKPSMSNAFDSKFHCIHSEELKENAFVINNSTYDVQCVFQIWKKECTERTPIETTQAIGFEYVKAGGAYDIAVRRVGGLAGRCYRNDGSEYNANSHYFIKFVRADIDHVVRAMNAHTFPSNTVGPRSLSKSEVNSVLNGLLVS